MNKQKTKQKRHAIILSFIQKKVDETTLRNTLKK